MQIFRVFLPLKEPLVATLTEIMYTSTINVAEKGMTIAILSKTFRLLCSKSKTEEPDQRDLNISDQIETLIPCSTIYFLGMRAQLLQKLATGNSSIPSRQLHVQS